MAAMGSRQLTGSSRGPRWWDFMQVVHQAGYALLCLLRCPTPKCPPGRRLPIDLMYIMYELHLRMENLSAIRRRLCKGLLASIFFVCTFTAFFFSFTSGGDRWVLNPLISDFEYPLIPEHALKVFIFCKYSFAICMVYNLMRYAVDRKEEMVALMDSLEREAAVLMPGQSTESRLDACVPRITDDTNVQEARQLVAMRRLLHRGVFTFDVVPEPEPVEEPEPSEDELQAVREAMELEAVKRLNDPKMLREYIRRRESRQGRRRVHLYKMKERRNKATRSKGLRVESPLNVIEEEESSLTQFTPELLRDFRRLSNSAQKAVTGKLTSQKLQHSRNETRSEVKWGITGLSSLKADGDNLDIDIRDLFPNVPSNERHRGLTDFLPCVMSRPPAGSVASASGTSSMSSGRAPLQAAKWPVSGTCRPTRSRPPSPSATQTLLTRASRSSSAAADSNATSRTHTPATRSRMASGGTVSEPPSGPTSTSAARERPGRPARPCFGHSPSPPVTPPPTPPVRPKTPRRSPTPPTSIPSSRPSSPPTTPPSPRARRRPVPGVKITTTVEAPYEPKEEEKVDTIISDKEIIESEVETTGKRINATPTHIIVSHIPRSISPTQPIIRKPMAPDRPAQTRTSPSPPLRPVPPPSPRATATQPRSKSIARPPSASRRRTPTPVGKKTAPTPMTPMAPGSSTPSSATASATCGSAGTRTPSGARSAGGTAGSGTPSVAGSISSATTGPLCSGICAECSSISSNQSSAAQGSLSSSVGPAKVPSPERTLPAASVGVKTPSKSRLTETIYSAWRDSITSKRARGGLSPKGAPMVGNKFQTITGPPPIRVQAKSRERRPVVVRTGREAAIKSAEGTRIWRHDRRSDRRSERRPDQKERPEKKPEQRPDIRAENRSEPSSKDLKKQSEAALVKEIFDFSNPTSESEGTSEVSKLEDVNDAGGDTQEIQIILQKTSSVISQKAKKEVEISNLLEPRPDWSDSASSLSGVSPSLTSTVRAFSDLVAANISQESSEELNGENR